MRLLLLIILLATGHLAGAAPVAQFRVFSDIGESNGTAVIWAQFSPRAEISPACSLDPKAGKKGQGALKIQTKSSAEFGGWQTKIDGLTGGRTYRFNAWYQAKNIPHERRSIIARMEWLDDKGKAVRPPDYAINVAKEGQWTKVEYITTIPEKTKSVQVQLALGFAAKATLWWDNIQLTEEPSPPDRVVRALTVYLRPNNTKSASASLEQFCKLVEGASSEKIDLVCLPEGVTVVGTGKTYAEVAEPIPGPATARLGGLCKKLQAYVVAGVYERVEKVVYNTAVLIGRNGELVGTYRKTHLPREEWEAGITAGDSYPVFQTDFGKVGLIICWDLQFPEPARAMAIKGAEILLLPIWGGSETLAKARAIENSVFFISSTYDMRSWILDPTGKVLAEATKENPIARAELHLDQKFYQPWIGDMKTRTWKERRPDIRLE